MTPLKINTGTTWHEYRRGLIPFQTAYHLVHGVRYYSKDILGMPFTAMFAANEGSMFWWGNGVENTQELSAFLLKNLHDEIFWKKHFERYNQLSKELIGIAESIIFSEDSKEEGNNFSNNEDSLGAYQQLCTTFHKFIALSWDIEAVDIHFENELKIRMQRDCPSCNDNELRKSIETVTTPTQPSFVIQAEIDLLRAALGQGTIANLEKRYYWLDLAWEGGSLRDRKWFQNAVEEKKKNKDLHKELQQIEEEFVKKNYEKKKILGKQKLSADTKKLIELIDHYCLLHDVRKECQMKFVCALYTMLACFEQKNNLPQASLQWLSPEETQNTLQVKQKKTIQDKISTLQETIQERKKAYLILSLEDFAVVAGEEAIEQRKSLVRPQTSYQSLENISGMAASSGKVQGRVTVAHGSKEALAKIKQGDVLVMGMTTPECVPAMKKAAAIVTDEGGITSHAAVISREFHIPCIVGTKIATTILKDGMLVEVNANHGLIKIVGETDGEEDRDYGDHE